MSVLVGFAQTRTRSAAYGWPGVDPAARGWKPSTAAVTVSLCRTPPIGRGAPAAAGVVAVRVGTADVAADVAAVVVVVAVAVVLACDGVVLAARFALLPHAASVATVTMSAALVATLRGVTLPPEDVPKVKQMPRSVSKYGAEVRKSQCLHPCLRRAYTLPTRRLGQTQVRLGHLGHSCRRERWPAGVETPGAQRRNPARRSPARSAATSAACRCRDDHEGVAITTHPATGTTIRHTDPCRLRRPCREPIAVLRRSRPSTRNRPA